MYHACNCLSIHRMQFYRLGDRNCFPLRYSIFRVDTLFRDAVLIRQSRLVRPLSSALPQFPGIGGSRRLRRCGWGEAEEGNEERRRKQGGRRADMEAPGEGFITIPLNSFYTRFITRMSCAPCTQADERTAGQSTEDHVIWLAVTRSVL